MLKELTVKNFRGFSTFHARLAEVTAIVGPNSSGKTSLLHAVRLACDAMTLALEEEARPRIEGESVQVCSDLFVPDPNRLVPLAAWQQMFTDGRVGEGVELEVELRFAREDPLQRLKTTLAYGRNAQLKMSVAVTSSAVLEAAATTTPKSRHRPPVLREALEGTRPMAFFVPAFYGVTRSEEYRTQPLVDRLLGSGDQSHIVRNLVARLDAGALDRLNAFLSRSVGARLVERTAQQDAERVAELLVSYRDSNGDLEISSAGTGLVALVALYAAMESVRNRDLRGKGRSILFLLDEPEAHLHPRLQGQVGEALATLASEFGQQLVLATHSIEMVNRLGRRESTMLLGVDRAGRAAVELTSESAVVDALAEFCDLSPFTSLSFLASRRLLFHEGPTDKDILDACARLYFRSDDVRLRRWRSYTPVSLEGVGNVSAVGVLKALLTPKLFPRIDSDNPVRVALVQDRDFTREPKLQQRELAPHFRVVEAVWSRHSLESLFLEPAVLAGWIAWANPPDAERLEQIIARVRNLVDQDSDLAEAVLDGRIPFHRRPVDGSMLDEKHARERAREDARSQPEVWQPGKARAKKLLAGLRSELGSAARLRGGLVDIICGAPTGRLSDPLVLIPAEVRSLLDHMAAAP